MRASDPTEGTPGPVIAVILPAFNEEITVEATIRAFSAALPEAEIVVVDNNSTDRTVEITSTTFTSIDSRTRLIREPRQGKGRALRRAFHEVVADVYVMVDADMTYPADSVHELLRPVLAGEADMVVGNRLARGIYAQQNDRPLHDVGNRLVRGLINRVFGANLGDILSGYRVMSREFVRNYPILVGGFEIEVDMTLHALDKQFRIVEIPIEYKERPAGSTSKLRTFSDGGRVLSTIARVTRHYRPLQFFGLLAVLLGTAGILAGIPVAADWIEYQYIYHVPLAILATGLGILAALCLAIGLILDSIAHLERMAYERDLLAGDRR